MTEYSGHPGHPGHPGHSGHPGHEPDPALDPARSAVVTLLGQIPVAEPTWRTSPADVLARGRRRHRRVRAARAGAGLLAIVAVAGALGLGSTLLDAAGGGRSTELVPAAPSVAKQDAPNPGGADPGDAGADAPGAAAPEPLDLADGRTVAYLVDIDVENRLVTFDVFQWLNGAAAAAAWHSYNPAWTDPDEPPNGDFVLWNSNPRLRTARIATGATLTRQRSVGEAGIRPVPTTLPELLQAVAEDRARAEEFGDADPRVRAYMPFNLTIAGGVVTAIEEAYLP